MLSVHKAPDLIRNLVFITFLIFSTAVSLFQKFNVSADGEGNVSLYLE